MDPVSGLILCGGESSRMGEEKCFLQYNARPQWEHLVRLLEPLCSGVMVSCQVRQLARLSETLPSLPHSPMLVADLPEYAGHGPMSGLLTGFDHRPDRSLLLIGCDYPFLTKQDLALLIGARQKDADAVCFTREQDGMDEPLVAVYERTSMPVIRECFQQGQYSLREALQKIRIHRLKAPAGNALVSVDTPEAFHHALGRMKSTS
jgi:molybdopterin-guanine dinucleotide biosynthesis protein A